MTRILIVLLILLISQPVLSGVIHVERNGSGDYTTIQDAVDVAASGDTITIGRGRFDEGSIVSTIGWTEFVRVVIRVEELTIIGAGHDITIIGPDNPYDRDDGEHRGIEYSDYWGSKRLTLINLGIENMFRGVDGHMADQSGSLLVMEGCRISGCEISYEGNSEQVTVTGCTIMNVAQFGEGLVFLGGGSLVLSDCIFKELAPFTGPYQLRIQGSRTATIDRTSFQWGSVGIYVGSGGQAVLRDCMFSGQSNTGIHVSLGGASAELLDCTFSDQKNYAINIFSQDTTLKVERMVVTDVAEATFRFTQPVSGYIRDSILAKGDQYVVLAGVPIYDPENPVEFHFDMTNNWWGTDDPDSIQSWIYDSVADSTRSSIVDWAPYKDEAVATETQSLGSLKSMYR